MNKFGLGLLAGVAGMVAFPAAADAQWKRAETPHFIIYSEESSDKLEDFARELELFDGAYRMARGVPNRELDEGNKVRVFAVETLNEVEEAAGGASGVAGFYIPRLSGPVAVVPRVGGGNNARGITPEVIFYHEYTHHLMFETLYSPMPAWLREGFAEFFGTAEVDVDKSQVELGRPAMHRADQLQYVNPVPMEQMLGDDLDYSDFRDVTSVYAWGWKLTHYLTFEESRAGQLDNYIAGLMRGEEPVAAAKAAFGDLDRLGGEMRGYRKKQRLPYVRLDVPRLPDNAVRIRDVTPGMEMAMPAYMRSQVGVSSEEEAQAVVDDVLKAARAHPDDAMVQRVLAEAQYDLRNFDKAKEAAERAIELDPELVDAHLYIAKIAMARVNPPDSWEEIERQVEEAKKKAEAKKKGEKYEEPEKVEKDKPDLDPDVRYALFQEAREHIQIARDLAPKDPEPLYMFYDTFVEEGVAPPMVALQGLIQAVQLAPYDTEARFEGAKALLTHNNTKDAEVLLSAIAYNTHGLGSAKAARAMIDLIREGKTEAAIAIDPEDFSGDEDEEEEGAEA
ncbi:DUF1570 domain-containing protein [Sphingomicrobium clamense]|uniref:DUF1570 domain-containing protein n=1 Tax=Sphingomicrobium clamense TaxID=2851013 RepID=A0ABS6V7G6_9SPHN|nr:DUF1570 domain-containing protein [Sphingomicrobium sp. B8]MBW0145449.1 DUF1570 domain-containing protein [Sphingomicrobium sp. B8]